jgi:hypothetical protein
MVAVVAGTGKIDQVLPDKAIRKRLPTVPKSTSKPPVEDWKDFDAKAAAKMTADAIAERTRLTKEEANRIWLSLAQRVVEETKKCGCSLIGAQYEVNKNELILSNLKDEITEILCKKGFNDIVVEIDRERRILTVGFFWSDVNLAND